MNKKTVLCWTEKEFNEELNEMFPDMDFHVEYDKGKMVLWTKEDEYDLDDYYKKMGEVIKKKYNVKFCKRSWGYDDFLVADGDQCFPKNVDIILFCEEGEN